MKILYASCRFNPLDRDAGSGSDFNAFECLANLGNEMHILGPFVDHPPFLERTYRKVHRLFSRKLTTKYSESYLHFCGKKLDEAVEETKPDCIFTRNLIPLVYSKTNVPIIYLMDAVLHNLHPEWPTYSRLEYLRMLRWEKKALRHTTMAITHSHWAEQALINYYKFPASQICVIPIPSSLPPEVTPTEIQPRTLRKDDLHLLLVGRVYQRKGIDIAIEVTRQLRAKGINANLRIVGLDGENKDGIEFMGLFKKSDPDQLKGYIAQYQWADFLLHPARFEAAGIVCGEAASFGVPTITNAAGGLATTVKDGVSGVVLPKGSAPEKYVEVVEQFLASPERYQGLRISTRKRFEEELNWDAAGKKIFEKIESLSDLSSS